MVTAFRSEKGVQLPALDQNEDVDDLLRPEYVRGSQQPHVLARFKYQLPGIRWEKSQRDAENVGMKLHHKEGHKQFAILSVSQ